jgi:hypothetical protein
MKIQGYSKSSDTHFYKIVKDKKIRISKEEYDKKTIIKGGFLTFWRNKVVKITNVNGKDKPLYPIYEELIKENKTKIEAISFLRREKHVNLIYMRELKNNENEKVFTDIELIEGGYRKLDFKAALEYYYNNKVSYQFDTKTRLNKRNLKVQKELNNLFPVVKITNVNGGR